MAANFHKKYSGLYLFGAIITIVLLSALWVIQVKAQGEIVTDLTNRLSDQSVPVKSVIVQSRIPFQIAITLQSASAIDRSNPEDLWFLFVAKREATLSYKRSFLLRSYTLILENSKGEVIDYEQAFLSPDDPSQQPFPPSKIDEGVITELVANQLNLYGFTLESLSVSPGAGSSSTVNTLLLKMSVSDVQTANQYLTDFMIALQPLLEEINAKDGAGIAVCRLWLRDEKGDLLLEYILDMEIHRRSWWMADGLTKEWFPHPPEDNMGTATSTPIDAYPNPKQNPYP
jgi:hypothetical protein